MADFELERDRIRRPQSAADRPVEKQRLLLTGLDCLPGQLDLFPTDGDKHAVGRELSELEEARETRTARR